MEMSILRILIVVYTIKVVDSLECFSCVNVHNISSCQLTTQCHNDENCYTKVTGQGPNTTYSLGCRSLQQCFSSSKTTMSPASSIIGRDIQQQSSSCDHCCTDNYCNKRLCNHANQVTTTNSTGQCKDDPAFNCELLSSTFDVCKDVQRAKAFCRNTCGLCDLVDGGWSVWSTWGNCDVTCASGQRSRTRTCTNPKPAHGGIDCVGKAYDMIHCTLKSCPIHGGWSNWTSWGSCSVSCGVGLQRRDRTCSQPLPGPYGRPCIGDARDDRVCFIRACTDGSWSSWGPWNLCSSTCDGGIKERNRTCTSPAPSQFGRSCVGSNINVAACNIRTCPENRTDGQWSSWTAWTTCTATCNGGMRTKSRACNNPVPTPNGRICVGNDVIAELCNNQACPAGPLVFFTVTKPTGNLKEGRPVFGRILADIGGGYNTATSQFVCPVDGLYHFQFSFIQHTSVTQHGPMVTQCYLRRNNDAMAYAYSRSENMTPQFTSVAVYIQLQVGDKVYPGDCNGWDRVLKDESAIFTGALIHKA